MKPRLEFIVNGEPVACARPRVVAVRGRGGAPVLVDGRPIVRTYMPDETARYEAHVALCARAALQRTPAWRAAAASPSSRFRVSIHVVRDGGGGDLDNFAKAILDGLTKASDYRLVLVTPGKKKPPKVWAAGVFRDDRLITQLLLSQHVHPQATPRAEVTVETANAALEEPLWMRVAWENGWGPRDRAGREPVTTHKGG